MTESTAPADWLPDPIGRFEYRYWNGSEWTEHVSTNGETSTDFITPQPSGERVSEGHNQVETIAPPETVEAQSSSAPVKITTFNAKKVATQLLEQNGKLSAAVERFGIEDAVERADRLAQLNFEVADASTRLGSARSELESVQQELIAGRDSLELQRLGIFDYEHPAEASATLATDLEILRSQIKSSNKLGTAITAAVNFTFNNSTAKGETFVNQMSRIMLRAYNAEAENAVKTVKAGNLASAQKRLSTAMTQIAKQGTMIDLGITPHYHALRLRELELAARHLQAVAEERELEKERRAELREQRVLEQEIKREKERLEKERAHYLNAIQRLVDQGDEAGAGALRAELDRVDAEIAQADYRAANIRAGYVYVISNLGAFGDGIVKIGMTRRLDPMDRVRELGDASVPFVFDVHALFFSDDAVGVEAVLHRHFAAERINKINPRKEFFRTTPESVLEALNEHQVSLLEFTVEQAAEDFRMSWPDGFAANPAREEVAPPQAPASSGGVSQN